ncbi:MAG: dihydroorotate dehydrogenase B catalytic subunit [Planctomycetaceae bacterium]|nr:dihydroorotate dehydrogenase B catalytic subunit [Planctomycetaceae bacterium]
MSNPASTPNLAVQLGRLDLKNPILVASGTFGYAREMERVVELDRLGGILPKTITKAPRAGNAPWRTVETSAGLLNSIGLDNDGIDAFIDHHLPYLATLDTAVIVSIAGKTIAEFVELAERLAAESGIAALELNISCPNVSGGVDYGTNASECGALVSQVRDRCSLPILAKLTPNVTKIVDIAKAAADGGADAVSLINTLLGMAIDWRKQRPMLGNTLGGLSGPAIKPVALRCVYQVANAVDIPIVGIGGIATIDDVLEFLVAGACAVQIGTANYYDPTVSTRLVDELPGALAELNAVSVADVVGTLPRQSAVPAERKCEATTST